MDVFEFLTPEEMDDLPDDPEAAFLTVVQKAQSRLRDKERSLDDNTNEGWREIGDSRYSFMNFIVAAARQFKIEPFDKADVPKLVEFDDSEHRQFRADLDHHVTQMLLDSSLRRKRDSVFLSDHSKDKVRNYIRALRECIDKSGFDDKKRAKLHDKLSRFEAELERSRMNLLSVARVAIEILAAPGAIWGTGDVATRLITNILSEVGEAQEAEEASRKLPIAKKPAALIPPRKELEDLDDEIPF